MASFDGQSEPNLSNLSELAGDSLAAELALELEKAEEREKAENEEIDEACMVHGVVCGVVWCGAV